MIWPREFGSRLRSWHDLRHQVAELPLDDMLIKINAWWFQVPWSGYYLHWDDIKHWPDPWQLLNDNVFCEVARGLGMLYTVIMIDRPDTQDSCLADCGNGTVLQIQGTKYILNWCPDRIVNISSETGPTRRSVSHKYFQLKL